MNLLQSTLVKISDISFNTGQIPDVPKNPRFIKTERYEKLKKSLEDNPEMLSARELLVYNYDGELIVIGGNMRLRAAKELGYKEIPCKILDDLTPEQIRAYVIKDNVSFGSDDFESLANEWDSIELEEWGMELPEINQMIEPDFEDLIGEEKNKPATIKITFESPEQLQKAEIDIQELIDRKYKGAYFSVSAGEI
jgi:hypothetical protein